MNIILLLNICNFTFIAIDVAVLIVCFQTFEMREYEDSQLTASLEISIKYDRFK